MASATSNAIATSKIANTKSGSSPAQSSQTQCQAITSATSDGARRSGGSGGHGAGASSRSIPSPRNGQALRKQHKATKRAPRLIDDDAFTEAVMMRTSGRKGQTSITHLMNYAVPHSYYSSTARNASSHSRHVRRQPTWGPGSGYHSVDKARFIHANYRFIVDPRGEYHDQSADADVHLDWDKVLQILVSSQSQSAACPICLGTPVAPRMARCGHIFCLPCLIRYMHSEGSSTTLPERRSRSKKCPMCEDNIWLFETRPARLYAGQEGETPREGYDVVLRLVMRSAGSTLALPRDGADALPTDNDIPWYFAAEVMDYARVMKGTEEYITAQFDDEIAALEVQEKEDELMFGEDNVEWTRRAIKAIKEAKEKVKGIGGAPVHARAPTESKARRPAPSFLEATDATTMLSTQYSSFAPSMTESTVASTIDESQSTLPGSTPPYLPGFQHPSSQRRSSFKTSQHAAPSEYYFYQALLHHYLSPLDIRILREAFGAFSTFPSTILPRVERVSIGHLVDDDLRRRTRYLAHLPYGCEVNFLECDWTDTVPPEVLERFKPEIEKRRKRNQEKETREEKARAKAEKEEEELRYAHLRRRRSSMPEDTEQTLKLDDFQPLVLQQQSEMSESNDGESHSTSPPWPLRQGSGYTSLASMSTSPSTSRTIWGTPAITPASPSLLATQVERDPADDGWLQGWEKDLLREDDEVLAQAQALSLEAEASGSATPVSGAGKKKKKKITLMSTTVRRGA